MPLGDLIKARDTLAKRIADAKVRANPLFIDLDEPADDKRRLDELRTRRREAEARLDRSSHISADGLTAMILIRTTFNTADVDRARRLLPAVARPFGHIHTYIGSGNAGRAGCRTHPPGRMNVVRTPGD